MNDARVKIGLVAALLFVTGSAVLWNDLYRRGARDEIRIGDDPGLLLVTNGGRAPLRPVPHLRAARGAEPPALDRRSPVSLDSRDEPAAATHEVRKGDTLYDIAAERCGSAEKWREIAKLNEIPPPYRIVPGQHLLIPDSPRR